MKKIAPHTSWIPQLILAASLSLISVTAYAKLNAVEDGGPSTYGDNTFTVSGDSLVPEEIGMAYPVAQKARIYTLGGAVRGAGMLAELQPDGQGNISVIVARQTNTANSAKEPYTPIALVRLVAPDGSIAAYAEFTDQPQDIAVSQLTVSNAPAGIWQLSFSGGREGDLVEFRLPKTDTWGIRGEMSLGTTSTTPGVQGPAYIWVQPDAELLMVGIDEGQSQGAEIRNLGGETLATNEPDKAKRSGRLIPRPTPESQVVQVVLPKDFYGVLTVEGVPGLLCPSAEAAKALKGGMVFCEGVWVAGPLQARARKAAIRIADSLDRNLSFTTYKEIPADLDNLPYHVLGFGKYAPINDLSFMIERQNQFLDPMSLNFARDKEIQEAEKSAANPEEGFRPTGVATIFTPGSFAGAATFDSPLNPAFHNPEIINRSALGALANIANMQGDGLMREGSLVKGVYPITHVFFAYPSGLAMPFEQVHELLTDEEVYNVWKQGLMAVGDKIADYQAYQSNQWSHMMLAHLETYMATGEPRFLGYFERQARSYYGNTYGPNSKFGLHPTGYYLEEYGPDGNYDKLNSFCVITAYYYYRDLPNADSKLVAMMKDGIERNLRFNSFFWLPSPDGGVSGPNAMNARKLAYLGGAGYPGMFLPKSEFSLAAAKYAMGTPPERGAGSATTFSFLANKEDWIRATIEDGLKKGTKGYEAGGGGWTPYIVNAYAKPKIVEPAMLPYQQEKTWNLPGMLVWKHNGLYGMVFSDVTGRTKEVLRSMTGGAISALWTEGTGTFISSRHPGHAPSYDRQTKAEEITFASIYGQKEDGTFFHTGKEFATTESNSNNDVHSISSELKAPKAKIIWKYDYSGETLKFGVSFKAEEAVQQCYVSLPMYTQLKDARVILTNSSTAVFATDSGRAQVRWNGNVEGSLEDSVLDDIVRLVVPIQSNGEWLWFEAKELTFDDISPLKTVAQDS